VKFKLDENLPPSSAAILAGAGHDVDTVGEEGLSGATDPEVVAAAGRVLVSLDVGLGGIRAFPPGKNTKSARRGHQVRMLLKCGPPQTAFNRFAAEAPDPPFWTVITILALINSRRHIW
jgi:Domain of unknown function (DUF5615)